MIRIMGVGGRDGSGWDGWETLLFAEIGKFKISEKKLAVLRGQMCNNSLQNIWT